LFALDREPSTDPTRYKERFRKLERIVGPVGLRAPVALLGFDHLGQLLAQLWAIVVTVHRDSVLHCRVYKFLLGICRDRDRAVHLAWVITAIHKHSGHLTLPCAMILSIRPFLAMLGVIKNPLVDSDGRPSDPL